ncbi:MAG: chromosome segregation protein SMC [Desulfuromonas sp.]|nr:MAG: chromosome segregation protein SMC [Desulfuromonas sp.]
MKIKRLDIVGFKSFVDKTSFEFSEGIIGVVGQNGCGKSNIVDAIRWSMGEQSAKQLRGRSMEDVIFGGSETRKPLGMAEVSIAFSNDEGLAPAAYREYAEIVVTRRLYRNGDSEYLINKTPCRLLDITELFMDTGVGTKAYSIIEQGKIGMVLNAKPEERRFLIEEAAGVTKFKARKKSALRKIDATRHNLERLNDIISEVRRQTNSLKRQAKKAERFRTLRDELRGIETAIAHDRYRELLDGIGDKTSLERQHQNMVEEKAARLAEQEASLEKLKLDQSVREREVSQEQERMYSISSSIQGIEAKIDSNNNESDLIARQKEEYVAESKEATERLQSLAGEEETVRKSLESFQQELNCEGDQLDKAGQELAGLQAKEEAAAAELEEARSRAYNIVGELTRMASQKEEAERRLKTLQQQTDKSHTEALTLKNEHQTAQQQVDVLETSLKKIRGDRQSMLQRKSELEKSIETFEQQTDDNENRLLVKREELNRHRARLESLQQLEKNLEGYGGGVKALMGSDEYGQRFGGFLADAIEVPARYEAAVEAVLGDRLQDVLAKSSNDVFAAFSFLRENRGRSSFLLSDFQAVKPQGHHPGEALFDLIKVKNSGSAVEALLSGVRLVDSLASHLAGNLPAGCLLVTEAGETLSFRGELAGGSSDVLEEGLLHQKREIKELEQQVAELRQQVEQMQQQREQLREEFSAASSELREVSAALHQSELQTVDSERELGGRKQEAERLLDRLEVLSLEENQLHEEHEELQRLLEESSRGHEERVQEKTELENSVSRLQESVFSLRQQREKANERLMTLKVAVSTMREREEGSRQTLQRLEQLRSELQNRTVSLQQRQEQGEVDRKRLQLENEELKGKLAELFEQREKLQSDVVKLREDFDAGQLQVDERETALKLLRSEVTQLRESLSGLQLKGRELELEAEHLRDSILEKYRVDLQIFNPTEGDRDRDRESVRMEELKRQLDAMGEVNLTAIEEFQELEERYEFLTVQQEDLQKSLAGLQAAISKINRTTRRRFRETFDLVNTKFQEVFPRLFRGGKAILNLSDEDDLLETGIDIIAQPPGKKLQNVTLLSGGEKALTAVALIFSIFMVKPSPFCLLDEVDAPLDDANIGRFNEIVREMSAISQFILITHNKRTMEIADTLYGVTMEEPGVSKTVSVKINEY